MTMADFDLGDYNDVGSRLAEFREKHPEGSLRPLDPARPFWVEDIGGRIFIVYAAAALRTPDDAAPGVGLAWEPFPGRTPYTKDSELQNAETSAWGRAIVASLAADARKGIASAEDVRNRQADAQQPEPELIDDDSLQQLRERMNALPPEERAYFREQWASLDGLRGHRPSQLERVPADRLDLIESLVNGAEARARAESPAGAPQSDGTAGDAAQQPDEAAAAQRASQQAEAEQLLSADPPDDWVRQIIEETTAMGAEAVDEELRQWSLPKGGNLTARRKRLAVAKVRDALRPPS